MAGTPTFSAAERERAIAWKQRTATLPDEARRPAGYLGPDGVEGGVPYEFCLPPEHAALSLLPEGREPALALFAELGIPWHNGVGGGPSNHLLSSQVQCVNALGQMVTDPERLVRAFGELLGTVEVLPIEPGRHLTFEYIGPTDFFGEAPGGERTRGARCTSVDAAFVHRTSDGLVELVLVEWKYTESYRPRPPEPGKDRTRLGRYGTALADPAGPVRSDLLAFTDLVDEPFYQLVRQQLLAHELEKVRAHGADRVRVVHVLPERNLAYQQSLRPAHQELGGTVSEVWQQLLRRPDRFVSLDSAVFADARITSDEYVDRYGSAHVGGHPKEDPAMSTSWRPGRPQTSGYPCPYCDTVGTYRNNIVKHLRGAGRSGGHELNDAEADAVIASIETGTDVDIPPRAAGRGGRVRARETEQPLARPVTAGHERSLALLQDEGAVSQTLATYKRALVGAAVYLRPTDGGLKVISLDAVGCRSMIGVGAVGTQEHVLNAIPPDEGLVRRAAAGYFKKRDELRRASEEERFVLRCIRHALANGLVLPGPGWVFLQQEWRLPTADGSGKVDLLAVDVPSRRLVVIECKSSRAGTTTRDRLGRDAAAQAAEYASLIHRHRVALYPFFDRLAGALHAVYGGPSALQDLQLDPEHIPATAVWWPGNPC